MKSYYMLIASLPTLPTRFDVGVNPITRQTLAHRLQTLDDDDGRIIEQLADFFRWDRQPIDRTDNEVVTTFHKIDSAIGNPLVRWVVNHRFEMRCLVAATRCRRDGLDCPELPELPVSAVIRRQWEEPYFGLSSQYPWLVRFDNALDKRQPRDAQHVLFDELWSVWSRLNQRYHFAFESIVLYLARWEILDRWASQDEGSGRERFHGLVESVISRRGRGDESLATGAS
jgi:hypothetical protein